MNFLAKFFKQKISPTTPEKVSNTLAVPNVIVASLKPVPSSLDMRDDTRVKVSLDGKICYGRFRGAAPDGSYAVMLDEEECLRAFDVVEWP